MMVLVDTSVWSLALRRRPKRLNPDEEATRIELSELIREGRAQLLGPIRQELLSGIREEQQFRRLREHLRSFPDVRLKTRDFEEAAWAANRCRVAGVAGSGVDFLICAAALERKWPIFTRDRDFTAYARHLPLQVHSIRDTLGH